MFCLPLSADAPVFLCSFFCLQLETHEAAEEQIDFCCFVFAFYCCSLHFCLNRLPKLPVLLKFFSLKLFSGISLLALRVH